MLPFTTIPANRREDLKIFYNNVSAVSCRMFREKNRPEHFLVWFLRSDGKYYRRYLTDCYRWTLDVISLGSPESEITINESEHEEIDCSKLELIMPGKKESFRRYECKTNGHYKFWEIWLPDSSTITTHWGKIGTEGQSKTKDFDTNNIAVSTYHELCSSKLLKGYKLVSEQGEPAKIKMPKLPPKPEKPKEPTAAELGLADGLDMIDI